MDIATYCGINSKKENSDDAFVEIPSEEAKSGLLTLLVDSRADTSLLKRESVKEEETLDKKTKNG